MDAVSEILVDRARGADRLARMMVVSLAAHAALIAAVTLLPARWDVAPDDRHVMVISLGGAPGPVQGRNPMSAKPIQEAVPETVKPKNDAPPVVAKPEMIEPVKKAPVPPKAQVKPEPPKETPQLRGRTPTQGAEVRTGTAKIETGSQSQTKFGGLATGGGGAGAAYTDYADFCCPEYLDQMVLFVRRNWQEKQGQDGQNVAKFTIRRDGSIADVTIEEAASPLLDLATKRALIQTQKLPPLPAAFTPPQLTVHLVFQYKR
jgi:outer membrane biosynthesis protein TonB